jgi:hypothetical protein
MRLLKIKSSCNQRNMIYEINEQTFIQCDDYTNFTRYNDRMLTLSMPTFQYRLFVYLGAVYRPCTVKFLQNTSTDTYKCDLEIECVVFTLPIESRTLLIACFCCNYYKQKKKKKNPQKTNNLINFISINLTCQSVQTEWRRANSCNSFKLHMNNTMKLENTLEYAGIVHQATC